MHLGKKKNQRGRRKVAGWKGGAPKFPLGRTKSEKKRPGGFKAYRETGPGKKFESGFFPKSGSGKGGNRPPGRKTMGRVVRRGPWSGVVSTVGGYGEGEMSKWLAEQEKRGKSVLTKGKRRTT